MLSAKDCRTVLASLTSAALSDVPEAWAASASWLSGCEGATWLRLDDNARVSSWTTPATVSGAAGWFGPTVVEPSGFVAVVTSLHADGRFRQRAVQVLAGLAGRLPAAGLALRSVDHVSQVRNAARAALRERGADDTAEVEVVVAILAAASNRVHARSALTTYAEAALAGPHRDGVLAALRASGDRSARRWAWTTSLAADLLTPTDVLAAAQFNPDQLVRAWCTDRLSATAAPAELSELLTGRFALGRLAAVERLPDTGLSDAATQAALLDRSALVRGVARWRAGRRNLDAAAVYRAVLASDRRRRQPALIAAALAGLSVTGSSTDLPAVVAYLNDASVAVRAAAVTAAAALIDLDDLSAQLGPLLLDPSPRVASASARALARAAGSATSAAATAAWASPQSWSRRAAWRLTRSAGGWDRLEADLRAAGDVEHHLAGLGTSGAQNWLNYNAATTYNRPSSKQQTRIRTLLQAADLGQDVAAKIAFHAGLDRIHQ